MKSDDPKVKSSRHSLLILLGMGLIAIGAVAFLLLEVVGTVHATTEDRQKVEEESAESGASRSREAPEGMDSLSDLALDYMDQAALREFVRALRKKERELDAREKALEKREVQFRALYNDIETKLQRLDETREKLEELTQKVDKSREKNLAKAAKLYSQMEPASAAQVLSQTDLERVVAVLQKMDAETAGGILDEMVTIVSRTDSLKAEKLKQLGEALVQP